METLYSKCEPSGSAAEIFRVSTKLGRICSNFQGNQVNPSMMLPELLKASKEELELAGKWMNHSVFWQR